MYRRTPLAFLCAPALAGILGLCLSLACNQKGATTGGDRDGDQARHLDLKQVAKEIGDNKPAAENKYLGFLVEVEVSSLYVNGGNSGEIDLGIGSPEEGSPKEGEPSASYSGTFSFADPRNEPLKSIKDGQRYRGKVRGYVVAIKDFYPLPNSYKLVLSPAWVEGELKAGK